MLQIFISILCVIGIAIGQILFKRSAKGFHDAGSFYDFSSLSTLFIALVLYGVTTIGWVWVLQKIDLGKVYPIMALSFVIVPIASYFIFHESFTKQYFLGIILIIIGILVTVHSKT